ncbi:MAG: SpoIVB peptidase [Clostridiales bacterium]|nr:SpoIVB peptidase [Clostridiales bacterium]
MERKRSFWRSCGLFLGGALLSLAAAAGALLLWVPDQINVFADETKVLHLPLKAVTISVLPEPQLVPGGYAVGVRMDVKGVLVVGLEEIETENGSKINPGLKAGLEIGDSVLEINGEPVDSAEDVRELVHSSGDPVDVKLRRKNEVITLEVMPALAASDGQYKLGIWVRNQTAGLGTLTFYSPADGVFGALGHAITDPDTADILPVRSGILVNARVQSVRQGTAGEPGAIRGVFYEEDAALGKLTSNTAYGIFGQVLDAENCRITENPLYPEPLSVGYQQEIHTGKATILTTLEGNVLKEYEVQIEKVTRQNRVDTKSMVIRITDPELLEATGGIVQGMSGSPILQDGKIIGAVTHVFVNDPTRGYGIFIEHMLAAAG